MGGLNSLALLLLLWLGYRVSSGGGFLEPSCSVPGFGGCVSLLGVVFCLGSARVTCRFRDVPDSIASVVCMRPLLNC